MVGTLPDGSRVTDLAPPPSRPSGTRGRLRVLRRPLVVTLPVVLLVGWVGLQTIQRQARREVADRLRSRSVAVGFAAGLIFEERRVGLRRLAAEPGIRDTILDLAAAPEHRRRCGAGLRAAPARRAPARRGLGRGGQTSP